jgi:hypothetical protein
MHSLIFSAIAAFVISLAWQSPVAAQSKQQQARSLGYCVQLANARGWNRYGEKGRYPFIRKCMEGRVG